MNSDEVYHYKELSLKIEILEQALFACISAKCRREVEIRIEEIVSERAELSLKLFKEGLI